MCDRPVAKLVRGLGMRGLGVTGLSMRGLGMRGLGIGVADNIATRC